MGGVDGGLQHVEGCPLGRRDGQERADLQLFVDGHVGGDQGWTDGYPERRGLAVVGHRAGREVAAGPLERLLHGRARCATDDEAPADGGHDHESGVRLPGQDEGAGSLARLLGLHLEIGR